MNSTQRLILMVAAVVVVLMILVPPWTADNRSNGQYARGEPIGYGTIGSPPETDNHRNYRISTQQLGLQCLAVAVLAGAMIAVFKEAG